MRTEPEFDWARQTRGLGEYRWGIDRNGAYAPSIDGKKWWDQYWARSIAPALTPKTQPDRLRYIVDSCGAARRRKLTGCATRRYIAMEFGIDIPGSARFDAVGLGLNAIDHLILVPHYPEFNSKIQFISSKLSPGGQVASAMVALSRLGLKTAYIGSVGSDELGKIQLESISSEGVDISNVRIVEGAESQTAFIMIDQTSGERTILWRRDPGLEYPAELVDPALIQSGRVLHLDGHDVPASISAAEMAKSAGIPVTLDIDNIYPGVERLLPMIDFLISSSTFPSRMTGEPNLRAALKKLHDQTGSSLVGATLGANGSLAYFRGEYIESPAFHIDCRDTTGAGDAFHGGFIYALLAGMSVEETLCFANAVAGLKCRDLGARTALPVIEEVRALIEQKPRPAL